MTTVLQYLVIAAVIGLVLFGLALLLFGRGERLKALPARTSPAQLPTDSISGADVRRVRFALAVRGYRMSDVDWTLDRLADELDRARAQLAVVVGPDDADDPANPDKPGTVDAPGASDPVTLPGTDVLDKTPRRPEPSWAGSPERVPDKLPLAQTDAAGVSDSAEIGDAATETERLNLAWPDDTAERAQPQRFPGAGS